MAAEMTATTAALEEESKVEQRFSSNLLDVLVRASLVAVLVYLCYQVFSPFLTLMAWSIILAVTIYPLHQRITRKVKGKQGIASILLVVIGGLILIVPTVLLVNSFADTVRGFVGSLQDNTFAVPAPPESVQQLPIIGRELYTSWLKAHDDLPAFIQATQPKFGELIRLALSAVASVGRGLLMFIISFLVAAVIMAYGESGERSSYAIFSRISGPERGRKLVELSVATIRAVALGVLGVAFVQAMFVGIALLIAGVPGAGVLSIITLVLAIAQIPALLVTLPVMVYIWASGDYNTGPAILYTILLLVAGMIDNALKPLMLGRGVDVPMPVVLFGALGGLATAGILGLFVGATVLALGYQIFMTWVNNDRAVELEPVNNQFPI